MFEAVFCERYPPKRFRQQFPRLNSVENLEEQHPEEQLLRGLWPVVNHMPDEVLRNPVGCPVRIREAVRLQDRVGGPRGCCPRKSPEEDCLAFSGKPPIRIEDFAWVYRVR
jgi:hypothetical protein